MGHFWISFFCSANPISYSFGIFLFLTLLTSILGHVILRRRLKYGMCGDTKWIEARSTFSAARNVKCESTSLLEKPTISMRKKVAVMRNSFSALLLLLFITSTLVEHALSWKRFYAWFQPSSQPKRRRLHQTAFFIYRFYMRFSYLSAYCSAQTKDPGYWRLVCMKESPV